MKIKCPVCEFELGWLDRPATAHDCPRWDFHGPRGLMTNEQGAPLEYKYSPSGTRVTNLGDIESAARARAARARSKVTKAQSKMLRDKAEDTMAEEEQ